MNRRTFLKFIAAACGAAVVCPGELLKPVQPAWMKYARCFRPKHKIMLDKLRAAALNTKYRNDHPVFIKARQQGCTNSILYGIPYWCGTQQHFMSRASGYIITKT